MNVGPEFKVQTVQALRGKKLTIIQLMKLLDVGEPNMRYCLQTLRAMGVVQTEEAQKRGMRARWVLTGRPIPQDVLYRKNHHQVDEKYDHSELDEVMRGMKPCKDSCNTPKLTGS